METPSVLNFFITDELDNMRREYCFHGSIAREECLDDNTNSSDALNPEHGKYQPKHPCVDSDISWSEPIYTEDCPYNKGETFDDYFILHKKFRFVEEFSSSSVYVGDSHGSHSYIDANEQRTCPQGCFCWLHDQTPDVFAFIAHKSSSKLVVNICSDALYSEVIQVISTEKVARTEVFSQGDSKKSLDGFCLLRCFQNLQAHLNLLRCYAITDPKISLVVSEMELLIYGFLDDPEIFKSFGFEHLYENGYLTFEQWKGFQHSELQRDISTLNERFIVVDNFNGLKRFPNSRDPDSLFHIQPGDFKTVKAQPFEDYPTVEEFTSSQSLLRTEIYTANTQNALKPSLPTPTQASARSKDNFGLMLLRAIYIGDEGVVEYALRSGASLNEVCDCDGVKHVPLIEAACTGHEGIARLLLNQGALYNDWALIEAAIRGHAGTVSLLLSHNRWRSNYSEKKNLWYLGRKVFDIEFEVILQKNESQNGEAPGFSVFCNSLWKELFDVGDDCTEEFFERCSHEVQGIGASKIALFEAAAEGHEEVVKILLDHGTNLEGVDMFYNKDGISTRERKFPVVEAAKAGHGAVMRLLLQRGATVSSLQPLMSPSITKTDDSTFGRLNKSFIRQYRLMEKATFDSSAEFSQISTRFKNHREMWSTGISTMRRLCNGKPPRSLKNVVAFLCISRAMSETLDSINGSDYSGQFLEDLERWQILFTSKELEAYRRLIHSTWGITLAENKSKSWGASDFLTLTHFQALLSTLIRQSNEPVNLYGSHDQSLRCSQQRFIARSYQVSIEPEVDLSNTNLDSSDGNDLQPLDGIEPKPPDIPTAPEKISLKEQIENDISAASLNATAVILMAGAIFVIVIIFLQWLRNWFTGFPSCVEVRDLKDRCQVLIAYLSLKADFAMPYPSHLSTLFNPLNDVDQSDETKQHHIVVDPFEESSQLLFSDHDSQSMTNSDESEFSQQGTLPFPHVHAIYNTPPSNSTMTSTSESTRSSPTTQPVPQKPRRKCPTCQKSILATNLKRHMKDHTGENKVSCSFCGKSIGRKEYLQRHERKFCPLRHMGRGNSG